MCFNDGDHQRTKCKYVPRVGVCCTKTRHCTASVDGGASEIQVPRRTPLSPFSSPLEFTAVSNQQRIQIRSTVPHDTRTHRPTRHRTQRLAQRTTTVPDTHTAQRAVGRPCEAPDICSLSQLAVEKITSHDQFAITVKSTELPACVSEPRPVSANVPPDVPPCSRSSVT